ncbi:hypothetical protein [Nitrosomonas sp. Nm58]|uniref:hypothetical protein n=1 Tax=Nitrosomonas sp. Nm58 TaxID=200126 RepID=UPI00115FA588
MEAEAALPIFNEAVELFMKKIITGKKSAPSTCYRLNRLADIIGDKKICDVTHCAWRRFH